MRAFPVSCLLFLLAVVTAEPLLKRLFYVIQLESNIELSTEGSGVSVGSAYSIEGSEEV